MPSATCELAITEAIRVGNALLKFISPNDAGLTGGHQCGFYLPKSVWEMYAEFGPVKGRNDEAEVTISWQGEQLVTRSCIKWYGKAKSEYRLTRFGKDFPFLTDDAVGDMLVLIPQDHANFKAFVLDNDDDMEDIQAALGVEVGEFWGAFRNHVPQIETENECIERRFRRFAQDLKKFPAGAAFSAETLETLRECVTKFEERTKDDILVRCYEAEYKLFRYAERQLCQTEIIRVFKDVDDFLTTAASIMNRRKSRAGRSLENHFNNLLTLAKIPFVVRPSNIDGNPDIVIPSVEAYKDEDYPTSKLFVVGVKTTCKERWQQVVNEAKRVKEKHLLTLQQGISTKQLKAMTADGIHLIVPSGLHEKYPEDSRPKLIKVDQFIEQVKTRLA